MPNPEWGVKRLCGACGVRFYDLGRDPVDCPKCGETYVSVLAAEKAKAAKIAEATAADSDEDDLVDDGDDLSLDEAEAAEQADDLPDDDDDDGDPASDDVLLEADGDEDDLGEFKPAGSDDSET